MEQNSLENKIYFKCPNFQKRLRDAFPVFSWIEAQAGKKI